MDKASIITWALRLPLAVLYLMMALPKFGADEMTVHIFATIGVEPWGRLATGLIEAAIFVLILIPKTSIYGVLMSMTTIAGALLAHFTVLGIVIQNEAGTVNDGGQVFATALLILALTLANLYRHRADIPFISAKTA